MNNLLESLLDVVRALQQKDVRFLVAGGLAVNAHGYTRATHDIDLVIQLSTDNVTKAMSQLSQLGYRPLVPVDINDFACEEIRKQWIREKDLTVFGLVSDQHPQAPIDVFVTEPFNFETEWTLCLEGAIATDLAVRFVSLTTLIAMKTIANRAKDQDDIEHLQILASKGQQ